MKKILAICLLFSSVCFCQTQEQTSLRELIKTTLNGYYKDSDVAKFTAYTKYDNLNIDNEFILNVSYSDMLEVGDEMFIGKSKDIIYSQVAEISSSVLMQQLVDSGYVLIIFKVTFTSNDYKNIEKEYSVRISELNKISKNFNKADFFSIVYKLR